MYGHTPNVWRPSEVPYPGHGDDIFLEPDEGDKLVENILCSGWHLFYENVDAGRSISSASKTFATIPIPSKNPYFFILVHWLFQTGVSSASATLRVATSSNVAEWSPALFVPANTTRKFLYQARFMLWGPAGFSLLEGAVVTEAGTGATYAPAGPWFSNFPGIAIGPYTFSANADPWDGRTLDMKVQGSWTGGSSGALVVKHIRVYGAAMSPPE